MAKTEVKLPELPIEEKKVLIKLPRTRKDEEDKVVWINNDRYLIKRGVEVEVPESVLLVLEEEERNLQFAYDYEMSKQNGK